MNSMRWKEKSIISSVFAPVLLSKLIFFFKHVEAQDKKLKNIINLADF